MPGADRGHITCVTICPLNCWYSLWGQRGLNPRPADYESAALTNSAIAPCAYLSTGLWGNCRVGGWGEGSDSESCRCSSGCRSCGVRVAISVFLPADLIELRCLGRVCPRCQGELLPGQQRHSLIAQRQSIRLLIGRLLVRIQLGEQHHPRCGDLRRSPHRGLSLCVPRVASCARCVLTPALGWAGGGRTTREWE